MDLVVQEIANYYLVKGTEWLWEADLYMHI